ncbi:MAG: hypothetical protein BWY68_00712 [bacterium ADurb.Bin400]|nr:MAG: hypothetical protein BWY68_00712 [bacterium ADurb.Bin400]
MAIPAAASIAVDYFAGILGARYGGASKKAVLYGFVGLILGLVLLPPFGGIIGLFAGVAIAEWYSHRNKQRAVKAAAGSLIGSLTGILINLTLALLLLVLFIIFARY